MAWTPPTIPIASLRANSPDVAPRLASAFASAQSPGLVLVSGLGDAFATHRADLFAAARNLAALPPASLEALEVPSADYAVGWSRGRERFRATPDTLKGSFYANPILDHPAGDRHHLIRDFPHYMTPNIWPPHPSCAALEPAFKAIGCLVIDVALLLASHCDTLVNRKLGPAHPFKSLHATLRASTSAKARLLNYYPSPHPAPTTLWCGYHNDHSILTALLPQQFYHADTRVPLPTAPDGCSGLYTHSEGSDPRKAHIPPDAIAFQIGEAAQIMSGGVLRATPHAVRMPKGHTPHLARLAFAVFLQPNPWDILEMPAAYSDDQVRHAVCTSPLVPSLQDGRWQKGDRFVDFAAKTIKAYQA